uniref:Uncharacterized protein n=1 Tax=Ditylenchus dipsaci TaxID=166011 RepID=A0A915D3R4_9BILA
MALGDSMARPHFFSGSGVSTGREGAEITADLMQKYNHGVNGYDSFDQLAKDINHSMQYIKDEVQQRGSVYAEQRDESSVKQLARQKMNGIVQAHCEKSKQKVNLDHEYDFRVVCSPDDHFEIQTLKNVFDGHVDEEGERC